MTLGSLLVLSGLIGSASALLPATPAPAYPAAVEASLALQDPAKPKAAQRPPREPAPEGRRADPPRREPAAEPRREAPRERPETGKTTERPKSTGEPELRRRKP